MAMAVVGSPMPSMHHLSSPLSLTSSLADLASSSHLSYPRGGHRSPPCSYLTVDREKQRGSFHSPQDQSIDSRKRVHSTGFHRVRCSWLPAHCSTVPAGVSVSDDATIMELPCLPFSPAEVFVPSSTKTLHLYEARFLALLDQVMGADKTMPRSDHTQADLTVVIGRPNYLFAHIVIEPVKGEDTGVASFVATYGCLARIESVRRLEIGALVTIRGIGRIKMVNLTQMEPFIKCTVVPVKDETPEDRKSLCASTEELKKTLADVQQLQIKIKTAKDETLQTPLEKALQWAEKGELDDLVKGFVPSCEERLSFAALQPVAGASPGELHKLLQERLKAMAAVDTGVRLTNVTQYAEQSRASLAAKVALQSLQL